MTVRPALAVTVPADWRFCDPSLFPSCYCSEFFEFSTIRHR